VLMQHIQRYRQADGNADSQAADIDEAVQFVAADIPDGDAQVVD